jgi:ribose 5-phosphate isomerase B
VLCIGAQIVGDKLAFDLLRAFLEAEHSPDEEFRRRVAKLAELEGR